MPKPDIPSMLFAELLTKGAFPALTFLINVDPFQAFATPPPITVSSAIIFPFLLCLDPTFFIHVLLPLCVSDVLVMEIAKMITVMVRAGKPCSGPRTFLVVA
jgi:hypothetical protein